MITPTDRALAIVQDLLTNHLPRIKEGLENPMKTQIITLWLAAAGSLLFAMIAMLDPNVTWRDCIGVHIGIWAMAIGQCWTQFVLNDKNQ